jgi:N-acetylglutamate synthase-like GNAT family acetyltransferase
LQDNGLQFIELEKIKYPWVNKFYKQVYRKGMASKNEAVFILKDKRIICAAKLTTLDGHLLLTGVACDPSLRGQGYASRLIATLLLLQEQPVYCFPYPRLGHFYQQLGFQPVDSSDNIPASISSRFLLYRKKQDLLLMVYSAKSGNRS